MDKKKDLAYPALFVLNYDGPRPEATPGDERGVTSASYCYERIAMPDRPENQWVCTREKGHGTDTPHVALSGSQVCARWFSWYLIEEELEVGD